MSFIAPGKSHIVAPSGPLIELSIAKAFEESERKSPHHPYVISDWQGVTLSYHQVGLRARKLAHSLLEMGFQSGDRLGIWLSNKWEYIVAQIGTAYAGIILVTINPAYRSQEFHHAAKLVGLKGLIMQKALKTSDYFKILSEAGNVPSLIHIIEVGDNVSADCISFNKLLEGPELKKNMHIHPNEPVNIQFTSGTTGHPKGSVLSHHNIVNNAYSFGRRLNLSSKDILVVPLPLYHCFGLVLGSLTAMTHGASIVLPSESFEGIACLDSVSKYGGTILYGVPTMLLEVHTQFMKDKSRWNVSKLRGGAMGGSPCPSKLMKAMMDDLKMVDMACAYGMTETSPVSFSTNPSDSVDLRCNTVGTILENLEAKLVDDNNNVVKIGEVGEILVKGYSVMRGYWNQEAKTKESIVDGFMRTGDLGTLDAHGYCRIVGRSKDMIIRGGENIFPAEIENFLLKMNGVQDVAVIGVYSERLGEEVCAWIRPKKQDITLQEVKDFCRGRIAHYKVPRFLYNVKEFPLTVTGKVQKNVMRKETEKWMKEKLTPKSKL